MTPKPESQVAILPDSTVWIDYFNPKTASREKDYLEGLVLRRKKVWVCPPVFQEVLQCTRGDKKLKICKATLAKCYRGRTSIYKAAELGAEIYRTMRTKGFTIRKPNDCLIAAYCILNDLALLHHDRDFDTIEQHYGHLAVMH
jgi:predicted nucleic acid-binding protein